MTQKMRRYRQAHALSEREIALEIPLAYATLYGSRMMHETKKHFGLLELPAIMTGILALVVVFWELGWRRSVDLADQWVFLQDSRVLLIGIISANLLFLLGQLTVELIRRKRIVRWLIPGLLADMAAAFALSEAIWHYAEIPPALLVNVGLVFSVVSGLFSLLQAKFYFDARRKGFIGNGRSAWPPALVFLLSLMAFIFVGGMFLLTPGATHERLAVADAFFLSASAVTVTGLTPVEINAALAPLGKIVVLVLMQIGAFGVMTFTYFLALMVGMGLSVRERVTFSELLDQTGIAKAASLIKIMVLLSFILEAIGAVNLYFAWRDLPIIPEGKVWWYAIFHAVSGFCNCGLSLFPANMATPGVSGNVWGQGTMITLMFCGSLGFAIYLEIIKRTRIRLGFDKRPLPVHWSTHAWLVARMTFIMLLGGGFVLGLLGEFEPGTLYTGESFGRAFLEGVYNAVAARTSGFNLSDITSYGTVYLLFLCVLMFIGGNPGSTSGGIMTSVLALVFMEVKRIIQGLRHVEFHNRCIARRNVERAMATIVLAMGWVAFVTMVLTLVENSNAPAMRYGVLGIFFETVSSFATCGFSMNLTGHLSESAKFIVIINMIVGRVGMFSFVLICMGQRPGSPVRYPETHLPLS